MDPLRLYSMDNTWYFEAYCHSAAGLRNFRLDRIEDLAPNGKPVSSPVKPDGGFPAKLFTPNDDDTLVTVQLTARGAGLADDYYAERTAPLPDGGLVAEIRFGNTSWLPMFVAQHGGTVRILDARRPLRRRPGTGSKRPWPSTPARLLSMPWWSWILIWIALIALSLLFFVLMGVRLFRQFMATVKELGAAGDKLGHLPGPGPAAGTPGDGDGPRGRSVSRREQPSLPRRTRCAMITTHPKSCPRGVRRQRRSGARPNGASPRRCATSNSDKRRM